MAVLCRTPMIQYSTRNVRFFKLNDLQISPSLSSVTTDMSRDSIVDRHCLRQRYVPYDVTSRPTSKKIWGGFLYGVYRPREWLWIDSIGKNGNETSHRGIVWQQISVDLSSLRSYGGLKLQDVRNRFFASFGKKDPLRENFQNSVPKGFIATPIDVLCSDFVKFDWRKSVKSCIQCALESESNIRLKPGFEPNNIILRWDLSTFDPGTWQHC